jgi:hypothetical protein
MARQQTTISIPKWAKERADGTGTGVNDLLKAFAFSKMQECERKTHVFEMKHKMPFSQFKKKANGQKKENFKLWDDFIVWEGLEEIKKEWTKRYKSL